MLCWDWHITIFIYNYRHLCTFPDISKKHSYFCKKWVHTGDPSSWLTMGALIFLSVEISIFWLFWAIFKNTHFTIFIAISGTHTSIFKLQWLVIRCSVETDISAYLSIIIAHFGTFLDIPEKDSYFPKKWVHTGDPSKSLTMETPIFLSVELAHFGHISAIFKDSIFAHIQHISSHIYAYFRHLQESSSRNLKNQWKVNQKQDFETFPVYPSTTFPKTHFRTKSP